MTLVRQLAPWCLLAITACGDTGGTTGPEAASLVITGRTERGATLHVAVKRATDPTLLAPTGLTVVPADAATVSASGDVTLIKAGALTISASAAGGATASTVVNVAVPPMIVFDGLAAGNRDIYRVALDGGDLVRITTNLADDAHPTSAAGFVVFNTYRDGNSELYSVPANGGTERRLTTNTISETQPALSPDGKRVAYSSNVSGLTKVWLASIDLAAGTPLTAAAPLSSAAFGGASTVEATPSWAPGSDRIALMTTATPSGGAGLFTAAAAASVSPSIVTGSGTQIVEVEPTWSFDGNSIAYAAANAGVTEIYVRDVATSVVTQLTKNTGSSGQPAFLADGRVVFTTFSGGSATIRWVDPATPTDLHTIVTTGLSAEHAAPVRP